MNQTESKQFVWLPLIIGLCSAIGMYAGYKLQIPQTKLSINNEIKLSSYASQQKVQDVLSFLQSRYVDSLNMEETSDFLIQQLMYALDPYSAYLNKKELKNLHEDINGIYQGAGISFKIINEQVYVENIVRDGPAFLSDLEPGDLVKEVNGQILLSSNMHIDSVSKYAQLNKEQLILRILKAGETEQKTITILKSDILNKSVGPSMLLDINNFYIKINRFSDRTYKEFMQEVEEYVMKKSCKNLVLDLRDNPGGLLDAAADILNQLVAQPKVLLFKTVNRTKQEREYNSTGKPFFRLNKIIVLTNGGTASAAEVIAGVLQDLDRAKIIGSRSFGKATIMELYPLGDGTSLELANSRIIFPSGRCIQKPYNVNPDSNMHWLSPYIADSGSISKGSRVLSIGQGIIPDLLIDPPTTTTSFEIKNLAANFVITHAQEIKKLRGVKNEDKLIITLALKNWINISKDKFIFKNKEQLLNEMNFQIIRIFDGEDQENILKLKSDPLIIKSQELLLEK